MAIPLVFPAYLIAVPRPGIDLPAFMNQRGIKDLKDGVERVGGLGHAGILLVRGKDGQTRYYEYGRYDPEARGLVQRRTVPDLPSSRDAKLDEALKPALAAISVKAGQGGLVKGVLVPIPGKYAAAVGQAETRRAQNGNPARKAYNLLNNSCIDFARDVVVAAGIELPYSYDPRPVSYMEKLKPLYKNVTYDPRTRKVTF